MTDVLGAVVDLRAAEPAAPIVDDVGVRTFALDTHEELAKILEATGGARDLNLIVRLAVATEGAAYTLSGKFGVEPHNAPDLLLAARRATQDLMGVSFHVGSQCMRPTAYQAAMAQASRALVRAGVLADVVDVGGGFPSIYPGMIPPDMADYVAAIDRGFSEMMVHETTELWCEPGRARGLQLLHHADGGNRGTKFERELDLLLRAHAAAPPRFLLPAPTSFPLMKSLLRPFLAAALANGMTPRELCAGFIENSDESAEVFDPSWLTVPAWGEYARRAIMLPGLAGSALWRLLVERRSLISALERLGPALPTGLFASDEVDRGPFPGAGFNEV